MGFHVRLLCLLKCISDISRQGQRISKDLDVAITEICATIDRCFARSFPWHECALCLLKWVASPQASSISKLIEFKPMGLRISCDEWANPFRIHWPGKPSSKVRICANQLHESSNGLCGRVAEQWTPGPTRAYQGPT